MGVVQNDHARQCCLELLLLGTHIPLPLTITEHQRTPAFLYGWPLADTPLTRQVVILCPCVTDLFHAVRARPG